MITEAPNPPEQDAAAMHLEVCIDSVESAIAAERGGAARVELCSDLLEGGITPASGLIATVRRHIAIGLFVMVRPRGGDFCYSDLEVEVMEQDILHARNLGADGIVLGILDQRARIDVERTRTLVQLAQPLPVTFHRAIDMTPDLPAALEHVIATGATRILTSGGAPQAPLGVAQIAHMIEVSRGRIAVMVGGGIRPHNIAALAAATGAVEFHSSARTPARSPMRFRKQQMSLGDASDREYQRFEVREENVRVLVGALTAAERRPLGVPAD
jgi:copper homeostasis protein